MSRPKNDINNINDTKSTIGEDIKKEKVSPKGKPDDVKPIKIGMLKQLQKGAIVPSNAPNIFP